MPDEGCGLGIPGKAEPAPSLGPAGAQGPFTEILRNAASSWATPFFVTRSARWPVSPEAVSGIREVIRCPAVRPQRDCHG
jgi:hypothetical protein